MYKDCLEDMFGIVMMYFSCNRVPFYSIMELFIETLTGTCFELHVSPFETVISVKAKIQRLEGRNVVDRVQ